MININDQTNTITQLQLPLPRDCSILDCIYDFVVNLFTTIFCCCQSVGERSWEDLGSPISLEIVAGESQKLRMYLQTILGDEQMARELAMQLPQETAFRITKFTHPDRPFSFGIYSESNLTQATLSGWEIHLENSKAMLFTKRA